VRASTRDAVRERAISTCEYCRRPDWFASGPFVVEHIQPRAKGGDDALENLAYACDFCNGAKYDAVEAIDPTTGQMVPLFHPRYDVWEEHFYLSEDTVTLVGLTSVGRATVVRLGLNRIENLRMRQMVRLFLAVEEDVG
jgi:hypothetical protein